MQLREMLVSLDLQELFDTAIRGMASQGYRCNLFTKKSTGDRCAVGHCMTPEALEHLLRTGRNRDTMEVLTSGDRSVSTSLYLFLCDLQTFNDDASSRERFCMNMSKLAGEHGLTLITYHAHLTAEWRASKIWQR